MRKDDFRRYSAPILRSNSMDAKCTDHRKYSSSHIIEKNSDRIPKIVNDSPFKLETVFSGQYSSDIEKNSDNSLPDTVTEPYSSRWAFIGVGNILAPFFITCIYTLIPVHNIFHDQKYWFELPLQGLFSLLPSLTATIIIRSSCFLNINYIKKFRYFLRMWLIASVVVFIEQGIGFLIWTYFLGFLYPIPLNGYIAGCVILVTTFIALWHQFPSEWRLNSSFRKRLIYVIIAVSCNQALVFEYAILTKLLLSVSTDHQWIIAIFLPFVRELNILFIFKLASKAAFGDVTRVKLTVHHGISTSHSLFLDYTVGSVATFATSIVILATDFLTNIIIGFRIIYVLHKQPTDTSKHNELLQILVINEMVECTVPIAYLLCFVSAYLGPNFALIGNVGNSYWQYRAVDNFEHTIIYVSTLFLIDLLSLVTCVYLLWSFCKISLVPIYIKVQKEFGFGFMIVMSSTLNAVSL